MAQRELKILMTARDDASGVLGNLKKRFFNWKTLAVGAAVAVGTAMVKSGLDIEKAQSTIVKGTGASGEALNEMVATARNVSRRVPGDLNDVAEVVAELNTRLDLTGDELENATEMMMNFARVSGKDGKEATATVSRLINAMGLEADEASLLLDKLTWASQASGIQADRLAQYITEAGPAFEEMGFHLDRSIGLFAQFEKVGARPEEVLSSLNLALNRMAQEGFTNAEEAFNEYLKRIEEAPDILSATLIASELFGSRVGGKIAEDIRDGRFEVEEWEDALQNVEGTLERTAENSLTTSDRIGMLRKTVMDIIAPTDDMTGGFNDVIASTQAWIEENEELIRSLIEGFFQVLKGVMWVIARLLEGYGQFAENLGLIFYKFYEFSQKAGNAIMGAWEKVAEFFANLWDRITDIFSSAIDWITRRVDRLMSQVERITGAANRVGSFLGSTVGNVMGAIGVQDAVITPQGQVIHTDPADYLFATKNPENLARGSGTTININITGDVSGQEVIDKVSEGIMKKLRFNGV